MISTQNHSYQPKSTRSHLRPYPYSYPAPVDSDELQDPPSLSSSPASQYSIIPSSGPDSHPAFSAAGGVPAIAIPRSVEANLEELGSGLMNTGANNWNRPDRQLHPAQQRGAAAHKRESSFSSLGSLSAGPTSPYNHNVAHPRIAVSDSGQDGGLHGLHDATGHDGLWDNYGVFSKTPMGPTADNFFSGFPGDSSLENMGGNREVPYAMPSAVGPRSHRPDRSGHGPSVDFPNVLSRQGADSVASSTIGGDSPATPAMGEPIESRRRNGVLQDEPPKLDRTMTDTYTDAVYIPNLAVTSPSSQQHFAPSAPFSRALEAASFQHLTVEQAAAGLGGFRGSSPFRNGSPLAPAVNRDFGPASHQLAELHQTSHHDSSPSTAGQAVTPQTISPKDSVLDFDDDADSQFSPLFPQQQHAPGAFGASGHLVQGPPAHMPQTAAGSLHYLHAQGPGDARLPQGYSFLTSRQTEENSRQMVPESRPSFETQGPPASGSAMADEGGTYSCTYHGCDRRFDSQKDLQTHKREGHRSGGMGRRGDRSSNPQTQQGPHVCKRINPSTGKVCGSTFSRPYDLTRHEDTIHNARKKKVRCDICPEEKLFSRRDALSRHFKVCHEELFESRFGKGRRRRG